MLKIDREWNRIFRIPDIRSNPTYNWLLERRGEGGYIKIAISFLLLYPNCFENSFIYFFINEKHRDNKGIDVISEGTL